MMEDDRALVEVWRWKDDIYKETKDMSVKEFVKFAHKRASAFRKKYQVRLNKSVSQKTLNVTESE